MSLRKINNGILELYDSEDNIVMTIEEKMQDNIINIFVSGEIRNNVAYEFEDEVMAAFSVFHNITIDFSKTTYIASLALRSLLSLQQIIDNIPNSKMIICGVSSQIKQVFIESGFYEILYIEE